MEIPLLFNENQNSFWQSFLVDKPGDPSLYSIPEEPLCLNFRKPSFWGIPVGRAMARFGCAHKPYTSISSGKGRLVSTHFPLRRLLLSESRNHKEVGMTPSSASNGSLKAALSAEVDKKRFPKTLTMKGGRQE